MKQSLREETPPADARDRLIAAALDQFTRRGYAATSVRELCEAAGVTKPVLYYYFKSKEGLYLEIMNGIGQLYDQRVSELCRSTGTVRQRLVHFFGGMFEGACENLAVVKLAYMIYFGPPQGAPHVDFNRFFDQTLALVEGMIAEGIENGEIRECDRKALAWALVGSFQTIQEEQICHREPRTDRAGLIAVINLILNGVDGGAVHAESRGSN
jgi:AcrR family transcriptional regulator